MGNARWTESSAGVRWLKDEQGRLAGFRDDLGREYLVPSVLDADGIALAQGRPEGVMFDASTGRFIRDSGVESLDPAANYATVVMSSSAGWSRVFQNTSEDAVRRALVRVVVTKEQMAGHRTVRIDAKFGEFGTSSKNAVVGVNNVDTAGGLGAQLSLNSGAGGWSVLDLNFNDELTYAESPNQQLASGQSSNASLTNVPVDGNEDFEIVVWVSANAAIAPESSTSQSITLESLKVTLL